MGSPVLVVGVGDIHGRFDRVQQWLETLERNLGRGVDLVLAVGDVEAFARADDHRRKAAKRGMPAEFAAYAQGERSLVRRMHFIAGNNEDFESLYPHPEGAELAAGLHYLGRAGVTQLGPLRVAFLSGIYAPKSIDLPLSPPHGAQAWKQNGYFRREEVTRVMSARGVDLLLLHEWPRDLVRRAGQGVPALRAHRFPWIGNPLAREVMDAVQPSWLLCGHSHVPLATTVHHKGAGVTRVACLDQAARPEGAVVWIEWDRGAPVRAGWGTSGTPAWLAGQRWEESLTPTPAAPEEQDGASDSMH